MSYTPIPERKEVRNGVLYIVVNFTKDGAETVRLQYKSDDLSGADFPRWCKRKVEQLDGTSAVVIGSPVDLTGVGVVVPDPNAPTKGETDFSGASRRYLQLKAMVDAGLTLPQVLTDELATVKAEIETILATKPNLSKRFAVR